MSVCVKNRAYRVEGESKQGCRSGFMSAEFVLVLIGALLQLCVLAIATPSALFALVFCWRMFLCCFRQRLNLVHRSVSMRLRSKRTCSGVQCFGAFHIKRFSFLFLFLRLGLT